ncbi:phage tail assembly protein [uncultured Ruegeria sp.]|uniref:phage tail assembly protein n=1 Tax=uncultured Ruegeria sp. TaxID=259304 RepID=UPI002637B1CD|nr:phage tail assembly protein [uncultured Ruegeria sp.]
MAKKYHEEQPDGSMLIDFSDRPLKIDGTEVKKLVMREPTVEDQTIAQKASSDQAEAEVATFANLTELSPDTIKSFKLRQYGRLQGAYQDFLY